MIRFTAARTCIPIVLLALGSLVPARPATAQIPVTDGANLVARLVEYAMQGLQYTENIQTVRNLVQQVRQLDDQIDHLRDAANGRIAALASSLRNFTSDPAQLLAAVQPQWTGQFTGDSRHLLDAVLGMGGSSLVDHLQNELDAADVVGESDLLNLFPTDPDRGLVLAERWNAQRESADRLRAADYAAAEAAGRLTQLLADGQSSVDGLRGQTNVSNTALQQAGIASQLTDSEINFAVAQLLAIESQKTAILRQEQELQDRRRLERWVQREQLRQNELQAILDAEESRRVAHRGLLRLPTRHGN